jgi:hypothetical protein
MQATNNRTRQDREQRALTTTVSISNHSILHMVLGRPSRGVCVSDVK